MRPVWTRYISGAVLGHFVNRIRKGETGDNCAFSLLLEEHWKREGAIRDDAFFEHAAPLIEAYERRHAWQDVLLHTLGKV
jgi:hypothetical protein